MPAQFIFWVYTIYFSGKIKPGHSLTIPFTQLVRHRCVQARIHSSILLSLCPQASLVRPGVSKIRCFLHFNNRPKGVPVPGQCYLSPFQKQHQRFLCFLPSHQYPLCSDLPYRAPIPSQQHRHWKIQGTPQFNDYIWTLQARTILFFPLYIIVKWDTDLKGSTV